MPPSMKKYLVLVLLGMIPFGIGCSWFKSKPAIPVNNLAIEPVTQKTSPDSLFSGEVINLSKLRQGGKLAVIPFIPGENVEANETLDHARLHIIKSLADELKDNKPYFDVLDAGNANLADFLLEGRITEMTKPGLVKKMIPGKHKIKLSVKGQMVNRYTKSPIFVFSDTVVSKTGKETFDDLGQDIGQHIGQFILTNSQ
jgi:hypothetical protein